MPRISVILPVYNGEQFVTESIQSILDQTYSDFELIVVDDASTDSSLALVKGFNDPRIRLIRHECNKGLIAALNHGLDRSAGEFVARMDADDRSSLTRFEQQVDLLDSDPGIGICGGWVRFLGEKEGKIGKYPISPDAVEVFRYFHCPFAHPTVMIRRRLLENYGLRYNPSAVAVEDFELWTRLLAETKGANLPKILLQYRLHRASITAKNWSVMDENSVYVLKTALSTIIDNVSDEMARYHRKVSMAEIASDIDSLIKADDWLIKISHFLDKNNQTREVLREIWFRVAMRVISVEGLTALRLALTGRYPHKHGLTPKQKMIMIASAIKASVWGRG